MKNYIFASLICASISTLVFCGPSERLLEVDTGVETSQSDNQKLIFAKKANEKAAVAVALSRPADVNFTSDNQGVLHSIMYKNTVDLINTVKKQITDAGAATLSADETAALFKNIGNWDRFNTELDKILTARDIIINHQKFTSDLHAAESTPGNKTWPAIKLFFTTLPGRRTLDDSAHSGTRGYTLETTPAAVNIGHEDLSPNIKKILTNLATRNFKQTIYNEALSKAYSQQDYIEGAIQDALKVCGYDYKNISDADIASIRTKVANILRPALLMNASHEENAKATTDAVTQALIDYFKAQDVISNNENVTTEERLRARRVIEAASGDETGFKQISSFAAF